MTSHEDFHHKDGWMFARVDGGDVRIRNEALGVSHVISASEWASVVAHVSSGHSAAEAVHTQHRSLPTGIYRDGLPWDGCAGGCNCYAKSPTVPVYRSPDTHLDDCPAKDSGYPVGLVLA